MSCRLPKLLLLGLVFCTACSPFAKPIYDWNSYNQAMAVEVIDHDNFNRLNTIQSLRSALEGMPTYKIPPGALSHLAFLMEQEGLTAEAQILIKREAELFPESSVWKSKLLAKTNQAIHP